MTPERYRQINALADAALLMGAEQRSAYLDDVCSGDQDLRSQVEALLASESPGGFLEKPVMEVLARDMLARPAQRDLAGRRIEDYEVISRLGAGGIGEVWLARDVNLNREVALKLLSPKLGSDPYHVRRLQQEARAASALNHPNIVTVYEIGKTEGVDFIAQERVTGETIRQRLARGPIPVQETLAIAAQAAAALGAAHSAGVVHRDIKPENIIVRPDGLVKVLDFGLARFIEGRAEEERLASESLSLPGLVLGTVRYMSPEQARGLAVDGRSDLFSLGVMLYEMVTGTPPFSGATPSDTLAAILTAEPPPLARDVPGISAELERVVFRCLAKDPAGRYASAEALRTDLQRLTARPSLTRRAKGWTIAAAACAVSIVMVSAILVANRKQPAGAFNSMQITRLVTRGEVKDAAISPDGKLLAYVSREGPGESLWLRSSTGVTEEAILPAESGDHSGLAFSPDNAFLYYRRREPEDNGDLYRVRVGGGPPERLLGNVSGAISLSGDGRRLAFIRLTAASWEASLVVSNADGTGEVTLATVRRPRYFDPQSVAWSPDGRSIALFAGEATRYSEAVFHLLEVRIQDRSQRRITEHSWAWPRSVAWSGKGDTLIVTAATRGDDFFQLWVVTRAGGHVARLTNDLSNYDRVSLTTDGHSLAAVQRDTASAIWVSPSADSAKAVRISAAPLRSAHIAVAWTPVGALIESEPTAGYRNLWMMDADGRNRRQLTTGPNNKDQIAITHDGRYIVYKQAGNIWRVNIDGTDARQLTHGPLDVHPDVGPDTRFVVYASFANWSPGIGGEPTLWRTWIDGGEATQISPHPASYPRESPDGKRLGCIYFPGKDPRFSADHVAILEADGTGDFRVFPGSPSDETPLSWSPDGKALDYVVNAAGVGNIWRQSLRSGPATQVTKFAAGELYAFAWSRDGRLACVRGETNAGLVLIENLR